MNYYAASVSDLHVIQVRTYANTVEHRGLLDAWFSARGASSGDRREVPVDLSAIGAEGLASVSSWHDSILVLEQVFFEPGDTLAGCIEHVRRAMSICSTLPRSDMDSTSIVLVATTAERDYVARAIWSASFSSSEGTLLGGAIDQGVDVFAAGASGAIIVVASPGMLAEAKRRVYVPLSAAEMFRHKVFAQALAYAQLRDEVRFNWGADWRPLALLKEAEAMRDQIRLLSNSLSLGRSDGLGDALDQRLRLVDAAHPLREVVAKATVMKAAVRANRHNILGALRELGDGSGVESLRRRAEHAARTEAQVESDLAFLTHHLDGVDRLTTDHQDCVLTALSLAEAGEQERLQEQSAISNRRNVFLAALAVWLGFVQIWAGSVAIAFESGPVFVETLCSASSLMLLPAVFGLLLIASIYMVRWVAGRVRQGRMEAK